MGELYEIAEEIGKKCAEWGIAKRQFRHLWWWAMKGKQEFRSYLKYQIGGGKLRPGKKVEELFEKLLKEHEEEEFKKIIGLSYRFFVYYEALEKQKQMRRHQPQHLKGHSHFRRDVRET